VGLSPFKQEAEQNINANENIEAGDNLYKKLTHRALFDTAFSKDERLGK
jgi:cell fate (sporulation/competence/biofilm development) regulator YmcA (YheA/YmcA/DUF963 family)